MLTINAYEYSRYRENLFVLLVFVIVHLHFMLSILANNNSENTDRKYEWTISYCRAFSHMEFYINVKKLFLAIYVIYNKE